jgi:integrase
VNLFDVRVFAIRRRQARRPYEVRWRVASRDQSKSFITRALADSYRAELVRAARKGLAFDPVTGEPVLWAIPEPVTMTWYQHAVAYADMKWPSLAAHSRASMAEALATLTPALTKATARRPPARTLRAALYGHAFNPQVRAATPDAATVKALAWLERASLAARQLSDPRVVRAALDALTLRLDGTRAAANTVSRKRAVFYNALGYAVELGLLPVNPIDQVQWRTPAAACTVNPQTVASPVQVRAILSQVTRIRPELTAFFGCLYYAALRPEEAVALRREHLILPAHGRGKLVLTGACPRTGAAWTITGTPYEPRGLKHRPDGAIRVVPVPPVLVTLLRRHLRDHRTAPDGRLFRGARGGMLSESLYGRIWHAARDAALGPVLAAAPLARRPYDLRHAAVSLWLNASAAPGEVAARAGNSISVLQAVYVHCIDGQEDITSQRIEEALGAGGGAGHTSPSVTASGPANRRSCPDAVRHTSAHSPRPAAPCTGTRHRASQHRAGPSRGRGEFLQFSGQLMVGTGGTEPQTLLAGACRILPTHSPQHPCRRCADRSCSRSRPGTGESSTPGLTCGYHYK